jgi:hypothetical protein
MEKNKSNFKNHFPLALTVDKKFQS